MDTTIRSLGSNGPRRWCMPATAPATATFCELRGFLKNDHRGIRDDHNPLSGRQSDDLAKLLSRDCSRLTCDVANVQLRQGLRHALPTRKAEQQFAMR